MYIYTHDDVCKEHDLPAVYFYPLELCPSSVQDEFAQPHFENQLIFKATKESSKLRRSCF